MAGAAILHIKDSYYFEVPKALWRSRRESIQDFPEFWVRLDPDYQLWEAQRIYEGLQGVAQDLPPWEQLRDEYVAWKDADHHHFGRPFDAFLLEDPNQQWFQSQLGVAAKGHGAKGEQQAEAAPANQQLVSAWPGILAQAEDVTAYADQANWSEAKIDNYNSQLHGKILIPQPFGGELRNLYQKESGFAISKFMVIEVIVAVLVAAIFIRVAKLLRSGDAPRGKFANAFEAVLLFMRDEVARPAIGKHDADKFVPLLWTIFFFVLGCNLMGMVPWVGAPTGSFGVTLGMALVTFATVVISGSIKFGLLGFWKNQVPSMGLPLVLAIPIVPMIFLIEVIGLLIRHGVLAIRLLANMVAGHLVLLGIMGLAFSLEGAMSPNWPITAVIAVVGSTLFSLLELFVAFLQAYIFTFLSALFIGAAVHHH